MFKIRNYRFGFDAWGLILFLAIMLPNFIWFAVPAANDVLRNESITPLADRIASVLQIVMVASLCMIIHKQRQMPVKKAFLIGICVLILLYYAGWCFYYTGCAAPAVILDLCVAPCLAFVFFSISRKNGIAFISACGFMLCHVFYGLRNFIL